MSQALHRLELPEPCVRFYTEHIEADAVHEQVMRHDVIGDLLTREPDLAAREAKTLRLLERVPGLRTPTLVAVDPTGREAGAPAVPC